jgi:hypothetical protein
LRTITVFALLLLAAISFHASPPKSGCLETPNVAADKPLDRKAAEAELKRLLKGRVAVLRNFYIEEHLHFDEHGKLMGAGRTGPWTQYARIEVDNVRVIDEALIISGSRNVVRWQATANEFENYTVNTPVQVSILLPAEATEKSMLAAMEMAFLPRQMRLSDIVPDYWKDLLTTERARRAAWGKHQSALMKNVKQAGPEIVAPKLLEKPGAMEIASAPFAQVDGDSLTLSFVVRDDGTVANVQITKPVGVGADDWFAEKIAQWKFKPATSGRQAVSVLMHARVQFTFRRWGRVNPFFNRPCGDPPNVYLC